MSEFSWKNLQTILLEKYLKYTGPKMIMAASIALSIILFAYPEKVLELVGLEQQGQPKLLVRWCLTGWLLFLGLVIAHLWYVRISSKSSDIWKLHEKKILSIGQKYDVTAKDGKKVIRITLKEISIQTMPPPYPNIGKRTARQIEAETATLSFDDFISILPGQAVKPIPITMPYTESSFIFSKNANSEEANSVFSFATQGHEQFFRCFVDHINLAKQEVEIDVYFLQMEKV